MRVVGENITSKVCKVQEALSLARQMSLDLVEISAKSNPIVCKIIDYSKFKFEQKKKEKIIKSKSKKTILKEIRFGPNTDEHDFNFKLKHAKKFLEEKSKVKLTIQFRRNTFRFQEKGEHLLIKFAHQLENIATVEHLPKMEGRKMLLLLSPKK